MSRPSSAYRSSAVLVALCTMSLSACAVLTKSQVDAVNDFGVTTQNYGALPGTVIDAYGDVVATSGVVGAAMPDYLPGIKVPVRNPATGTTEQLPVAKAGVRQLENARTKRQAFAQQAAIADASLVVLDRYATALRRLSSDEFTDALDESAVDLGQSLDDSVKAYNDVAARPQPMIGSIVAQAVSGVGRLYIRRRQTVLLQAYVTQADPVVADLTKVIEDFITTVIKPQIATNKNEIAIQFETIALASRRIDVATARSFSDLLGKADETDALADSVVRSAAQYRAAHAALLESVRQKRDLKGEIAQIRTLSDEIKAATKLKSKFD